MGMLARKFSFDFHSEERIGFFRFFFGISWAWGERKINHIEGTLFGHRIHIYDRILFSPHCGMPMKTVVKLDDTIVSGKENFSLLEKMFPEQLANVFWGAISVRNLQHFLLKVQENRTQRSL